MIHFVYLAAAMIFFITGTSAVVIRYLLNKNCIEQCLLGLGAFFSYLSGITFLFSIFYALKNNSVPGKTFLSPAELFLIAVLKYGVILFFVMIIPLLKKQNLKKATAFATGFASFKLILFGLVFLLGVGDDACNPGFLSTLSYHYHNDFFAFLSDMRLKHYWTLLVLVVERISIFFIDFFLIVIFLYAFKRKNIILFVFVILYETFVNKIADIFNNTTCIELLDFSIYKTVILTVILALISGIIARSLKNRWQEDNLKTES